MHLTDSHAHLDMYSAADLPEVLATAYASQVRTILAIGIGDGPHQMHRALEIAEAFSGQPQTPTLFASAGIHPQEAHQATPDALNSIAALAQNPRCIAIGEIGLDYYHVDNPPIAIQQTALLAQLKIAGGARKPILIHCRTSELATPEARQKFAAADAWEDLLHVLCAHWSDSARGGIPAGILHCFSGSLDHARRALDLGFYLSFAGNLTYPKSAALRDVAAFAPADRILVETDAPFLAPIPHRGQRNQPALVVHTAVSLAGLRNLAPEALAALTTANFHTLFNLQP